MVYLCIACIVLSSIALHGIALHRIAWHCIAFDYLLWYCMVLQRLHGVVQLIWRLGELPRSASSHFDMKDSSGFAGEVFQVQHVQLPLLSHGGSHCKGVQLHPDLQQSWMEGNL